MRDPYASELDLVAFKLRNQFAVSMLAPAEYIVWEPEPDPMGSSWRSSPLRPREVLWLMRAVFGYEVRRAMGRPRRVAVVTQLRRSPLMHFRVSGIT